MFNKAGPQEMEDFATELVLDFSKRCPAAELGDGTRTMALARAVDHVCNRAADFQRDRKLGFYRRAKLGTAFKLQMMESGYAEEFVVELTYKLLTHMSGK